MPRHIGMRDFIDRVGGASKVAELLRKRAREEGLSDDAYFITPRVVDEWAEGVALPTARVAQFVNVVAAHNGVLAGLEGRTRRRKKKSSRREVYRKIEVLVKRIEEETMENIRYPDSSGNNTRPGFYKDDAGRIVYVFDTVFGLKAQDLEGKDIVPPGDRFCGYSPQLTRVEDPIRQVPLRRSGWNAQRLLQHYHENAWAGIGKQTNRVTIRSRVDAWKKNGHEKG